jgi:hypothetical protein
LLFIDLLLVITNPFYPRMQREKKYYTVLILNIVLGIMYINYQVSNYNTYDVVTQFDEESNFLTTWKYFILLLYTIITCTAIYVAFLLSRQGTSRDLKRKVLIRHIFYFFLFSMMILNAIQDTFIDEFYHLDKKS